MGDIDHGGIETQYRAHRSHTFPLFLHLKAAPMHLLMNSTSSSVFIHILRANGDA